MNAGAAGARLTLQSLRPPRVLRAAPPPRLPRRAPPPDKVNGSLRPAHAQDTHWLPAACQHSWVGPATEGVRPSPADSLKGSRGRALSSGLSSQSASQPPPLDVALRKLPSCPAAPFRPGWGCCTPASSGPGLNISFSPSPTSQGRPSSPGMQDRHTNTQWGAKIFKHGAGDNKYCTGGGRAGGSRSVVSASGLQGPARRVKRREPGSG